MGQCSTAKTFLLEIIENVFYNFNCNQFKGGHYNELRQNDFRNVATH